MKSDIRAELVKGYHVSCLLLALQHHPSLKPEDFQLIRHGWFPVQHMTLDQAWAWLFNRFSSQWCLSETNGIKDPKLSFALFLRRDQVLVNRTLSSHKCVCLSTSFFSDKGRWEGPPRFWKWWCVFIDREVQHKKLWQRLLWTLYVFFKHSVLLCMLEVRTSLSTAAHRWTNNSTKEEWPIARLYQIPYTLPPSGKRAHCRQTGHSFFNLIFTFDFTCCVKG